MSDLADLALATISQAQRRVELVAQNIANATTPAYKRRIAFASLVASDTRLASPVPEVSAAIDFRPGKIQQTGSPTDLAVAGPGYFALRSGEETIYTRQGQLRIDGEGRLVNDKGFALQLANGGDLVVKSAAFSVRNDGTVVEKGEILGRIAVFAPNEEKKLQSVAGGFRADPGGLALAEDALVRQGAFETSNVSTGDEMVAMMEALRRAEAGQRIMNVYDDLMGRVVTSFGDSVR